MFDLAPHSTGRSHGRRVLLVCALLVIFLVVLAPTQAAAQSSYPEQFTISDAQQVVNYANGNSKVRLTAIWNLQKGKQCPSGQDGADPNLCSGVARSTYQFSHIFETF